MDVLLAQLRPAPGEPAANARRVAETVAALPDADLAVFPELFLSGYDPPRAHEHAVEARGAEIDAIRAAAADAGTAIAVGFAEHDAGGRPYNSLALIDEGGHLAAVYRKTQLFGAERDAFAPGDRLVVAPLAGVRVGALVCFDIEFPEPARALCAAGAELLVTASANPAPYHADHELASRARALDNRRPHVYVNRVGEEAGLRFVGGSRAVRSDGSVQVECDQQSECVSLVRVDRHQVADDAVEYLAQVPEQLPVQLVDAVPGERR